MAEGAINVFTIAGDQPFLDRLAEGISARHGATPLGLAAVSVILPTRRACRGLHDAFLRLCGGQPALLPRFLPLGDLDAEELDLTLGDKSGNSLAIPPALPEMRRRLLLIRLILRWGQQTGHGPILPAQAAVLARDLSRLLDQVQTERLGFEALDSIVPDELAEHWKITREFLEIVTSAWPKVLDAYDALDPAARRNQLIEGQIAAWRLQAPPHPVIAAGFAAASPAAGDLLAYLAHQANGAVVLPGVDTQADDALWAAIGSDPTHPQYGLHHLLLGLGTTHDSLKLWSGEARQSPRIRLVSEIMRPASVSDRWTELGHLDATSLDGIARYDCAGAQEEAGVIALLLREQLETPGATGILVTPDRGLARRVAAELKRWEIDIDDSAGIALNLSPPGVFLRLIAQAAAEHLAPIPLLALLKHPLAGLNYETGVLRGLVRRFEIQSLRGPRQAPGLAGLAALTHAGAEPDIAAMLDRLATTMAPFLDLIARPSVSLHDLLTAHIEAAERLAGTEAQNGTDRLWDEESGAALADFVSELRESAADFVPLSGDDYPVLLETLLAGGTVRPRFGKHPRLQILGTLEARLQHADLMILGGLNEGVWPADPGQDPWMSRPMRRSFGLPPVEAQIGLAAHDLAAGLMARQVVLTRALRVDGAPTVPSRWLLRLETVLKASGLILAAAKPVITWQDLLDRPDRITRLDPPAPCPPASARPRSLSVTEIETWRRDPYAIYAKHILGLTSLDPIDQDPGAADRGSFIHQALDRFLQIKPHPTGDAALAALLDCGREAFGDTLDQPGIWAFWWPRFERIASWFLEWEVTRADQIVESYTEQRGVLQLPLPIESFKLRARADRIDRLQDGSLVIIDYKTGGVPSALEVEHGFSPQLPLEAAMAAAGGFERVPAGPVSKLLYLKLSGGDPAGAEIRAGGNGAAPDALASEAIEGLKALIELFADPETPYLARPDPERAPRYSDYIHLARLEEWGGGGNE